MIYVMAVLRIVHIFAGVFWAGVAFMNAGLLQPAVARMGPEGGRFAQQFMRGTQLSKYMSWAALLATLPGILLYAFDSGFRPAWIVSGIGTGLTIGGLAGIAAYLHGTLVTGRTASRIGVLGGEIQKAGGAPTPAQVAEMQALQARMQHAGRVSAILLVVSVLGMAVARYLPW